ncbi:hypothetical protein BKA69DRAFT_1057071 [Paraphysoderma sedebokerense]|nr:hypothetical protein BKA69DRAFT_1057071 [Paraphysoderma sedebokerense]
MGVSANFLYNARKSIWTKRRILRYFFIRGGLLVFLGHLNYMLLNHSERFSFGLTVLFALGIDLILCGITVTLFDHFCSTRKREALGIGCLVCTLIILYCLTEYVIAYARRFPPATDFNLFLRLTILPGPIGSLESLYAFLPWYIPALWGIIYSKTFNTTTSIRGFVINMIIGLSFIVIYIPLHEFNIGTLFPPQSSLSEFEISSVHPVIELLYNTKYPPSLTFLLLNLGLTHIILSVCFLIDCPCSSPNSTEERDDSGTDDSDDNYSKSIWNSCKYILKIPLVLGSMMGSKFILPIFYTLGKSALFFYMLHLVGYRVLSILVNWKLKAEHDVGENVKIGVGINETFWLLWALGMMIIWPCCRIFERFKHSRSVDSVWRFF